MSFSSGCRLRAKGATLLDLSSQMERTQKEVGFDSISCKLFLPLAILHCLLATIWNIVNMYSVVFFYISSPFSPKIYVSCLFLFHLCCASNSIFPLLTRRPQLRLCSFVLDANGSSDASSGFKKLFRNFIK